MFLFHCLGHAKGPVQPTGTCPFHNKASSYGEELLPLDLTPSWKTTPYQLSTTAYSIYTQLPSILEAIPPSTTWGHTTPWWRGPTYNGHTRGYQK